MPNNGKDGSSYYPQRPEVSKVGLTEGALARPELGQVYSSELLPDASQRGLATHPLWLTPQIVTPESALATTCSSLLGSGRCRAAQRHGNNYYLNFLCANSGPPAP